MSLWDLVKHVSCLMAARNFTTCFFTGFIQFLVYFTHLLTEILLSTFIVNIFWIDFRGILSGCREYSTVFLWHIKWVGNNRGYMCTQTLFWIDFQRNFKWIHGCFKELIGIIHSIFTFMNLYTGFTILSIYKELYTFYESWNYTF